MEEGATIGSYRIVRQLGAGAMGEVWLAEHTLLGRRAAIKLLHPQYTHRPDVVTRFFNEAKAATAIADPGIVQVFDFGHASTGAAYIVMEALDGETLTARLGKLGRIPVGDALRIMRQVAGSVGAAHARGVVHRDLKPDNLFLVPDPEVAGGERAKILDFGIAKLAADPAAGTPKVKTQTNAQMGTPTFMAPEQWRGAGFVDQRADVYALGCVLYYILVGQPPFLGEGVGELAIQHIKNPPPVPSSKVAEIPQLVDALILRCLEKDPAKRFENGAELARAMGEILVALGVISTVGSGVFPKLQREQPRAITADVDATIAPVRYATPDVVGAGPIAVGTDAGDVATASTSPGPEASAHGTGPGASPSTEVAAATPKDAGDEPTAKAAKAAEAERKRTPTAPPPAAAKSDPGPAAAPATATTAPAAKKPPIALIAVAAVVVLGALAAFLLH